MITQEAKESHYKQILKALTDKRLISLEIAHLTGLTQHQVSRRTSELIKLEKIDVTGYKRVYRSGAYRRYSIYEKIK